MENSLTRWEPKSELPAYECGRILDKFQEVINIDSLEIVITGSFALNLMGFNVPIHDIDLLINKWRITEEQKNILVLLQKANPVRTGSQQTLAAASNEVCYRFWFNNIAFDVFLVEDTLSLLRYKYDKLQYRVAKLSHIVEAKKRYNRKKDLEHLIELTKQIL